MYCSGQSCPPKYAHEDLNEAKLHKIIKPVKVGVGCNRTIVGESERERKMEKRKKRKKRGAREKKREMRKREVEEKISNSIHLKVV